MTPTLGTPRRVATAVVLVAATLALAGCADDSTSPAVDGDDAAATDDGDGAPSVTDPGQQPDGFTTVEARITDADGEVCEVCLWLADDAAERGRGLMGVTDLGDADGMVFRFDEARSGSFYMFQTPSPLSIAWFAPGGDHIGSADMDPCPATEAGDCPLYSPGEAYDLAIEVFAGGLEAIGIGPGSSVALVEGSEAESCSGSS